MDQAACSPQLSLRSADTRDIPEAATTQPARPTDDALLKEYQELCSNMRHYGNARLTRLVMFLALTGGLLSILVDPAKAPRGDAAVLLRLAGAILAILFWMVDMDVVFNYRCFRDRALEIEKILLLRQYSSRKERKQAWVHYVVTETNSTYLLYGFATALWLKFALL
ncbi:MAG TPA: hypothetical protein VMU84_08495 [Thermoanaerobaculia bacterium]|nr:hypothetical protein [Thermoanaerobaculia bacterium]